MSVDVNVSRAVTPPVVVQMHTCKNSNVVSQARLTVAERCKAGAPTFCVSVGTDTNEKNGARKQHYRVIDRGLMKVVKVPLEDVADRKADSPWIFISHNVGCEIHKSITKFLQMNKPERTYQNLVNLLLHPSEEIGAGPSSHSVPTLPVESGVLPPAPGLTATLQPEDSSKGAMERLSRSLPDSLITDTANSLVFI